MYITCKNQKTEKCSTVHKHCNEISENNEPKLKSP